MAVQMLDAKGLKCPQPTLKVTAMAIKMKPGDVLEVVADCDTFEKDTRSPLPGSLPLPTSNLLIILCG